MFIATAATVATPPGGRAANYACASALGDDPGGEGRDHVLAVGLQRGFLGVVLEVDRELVDAERGKLLQPRDMIGRRPEDAEAVDHVVGDEVGVRVPGPTVLVVVVVGDGPRCSRSARPGSRAPSRAVAGDDVGDVVADHAAEPAALVALVREIVAHVGGRGDADLHLPRGRGPRRPRPRAPRAMLHAAMSGSASWRMKPSPISPVSASAFGPYAATQMSRRLSELHGNRSSLPLVLDRFAVREARGSRRSRRAASRAWSACRS